ncbi:histone deacetylase family protein [Parvularcula dongshanensis]|uniref:Acetoin utilization deacetylase AcuC-like enzyme n=1 Tax=Parvularcula dongshanensis TaxID=1173995 RepID=A0A840I1B1_9PROT|nr:histone deacetylase [Parvularcula dongshanensis]MBB4658024.1 acetoin utilization deacetylase AcuC-like enzyme [Parvularcula dongshanensis]
MDSRRAVIFFASDDFDLKLPDGHRFPGQKYGMLRRALLREGVLREEQVAFSPLAEREDVLRAHDAAYVDALEDGSIDARAMRRIGFPWSEQIARRGRRTVGGQLAAARAALAHGLSGQMAGGTHHAHRGFGAGFCIYNDQAATALALLAEEAVDRIAIVDLDVHQGDGNASILGEEAAVFILDVYGEKNFPFRKVPATVNVPLADGLEDEAYLRAVEARLDEVWSFRPDMVLYQAGVDPLASDKLGRLNVSFDGLARRDRLVLEGCWRRGIPCSMAIGGGYAVPIEDSVRAYANTYRVASEVYRF